MLTVTSLRSWGAIALMVAGVCFSSSVVATAGSSTPVARPSIISLQETTPGTVAFFAKLNSDLLLAASLFGCLSAVAACYEEFIELCCPYGISRTVDQEKSLVKVIRIASMSAAAMCFILSCKGLAVVAH